MDQPARAARLLLAASSIRERERVGLRAIDEAQAAELIANVTAVTDPGRPRRGAGRRERDGCRCRGRLCLGDPRRDVHDAARGRRRRDHREATRRQPPFPGSPAEPQPGRTSRPKPRSPVSRPSRARAGRGRRSRPAPRHWPAVPDGGRPARPRQPSPGVDGPRPGRVDDHDVRVRPGAQGALRPEAEDPGRSRSSPRRAATTRAARRRPRSA